MTHNWTVDVTMPLGAVFSIFSATITFWTTPLASQHKRQAKRAVALWSMLPSRWWQQCSCDAPQELRRSFKVKTRSHFFFSGCAFFVKPTIQRLPFHRQTTNTALLRQFKGRIHWASKQRSALESRHFSR